MQNIMHENHTKCTHVDRSDLLDWPVQILGLNFTEHIWDG